MNLVPGNGRLICGDRFAVVREVLDEMEGKLFTKVETFGSDDAKWQARYIDFAGERDALHRIREGKLGRI
jgi:hypothetical protein